ncbi:MAG: GT4 family glycosyltransferase PelF [Provencibacterium sp.]|nr:GT4 family glycosyltransferase PelF [Provencibacterium sp.]
MRICLIAEGCYPYVVGGVSSWIHSLIQSFPEQEFVIQSIISDRSLRGKFVYPLPENVSEVYELYLNDLDWGKSRRKKKRMDRREYQALRSLLLNQHVDWEMLFDFFKSSDVSLNSLLMGEDFMNAVTECYKLNYSQIVFSDFLWVMRSIYLPLFFTLKTEMPKADLYHCLATGYAGVLGSMAKHFHGGRLLISEHGIYTREREEELIKAKWVQGIYKNVWIDQFKKMSTLAYDRGDLVTSLYEHARQLQLELGCPPQKTMVTPNGICAENFQNLPGKREEDEGFIHIGAILRVAPIKDVKTLIWAFHFAKERVPNLKLWIMGPCSEEEEYAKECFELVESLKMPDVVFTGRVNVPEYLGRMDMTILTSISEGQPLTILESFAAHKPVIATDVGNCSGLVLGEGDDFGPAGVITHVMNVEEIAQAIVTLAHSEALRQRMGESGYRRLMAKYQIADMNKKYREIYKSFSDSMGLKWETDAPAQSEGEKEPVATAKEG